MRPMPGNKAGNLDKEKGRNGLENEYTMAKSGRRYPLVAAQTTTNDRCPGLAKTWGPSSCPETGKMDVVDLDLSRLVP